MKLAVRNRTNVGCALLKFQPWGLSFHERMKIFRDVVDGERIRIQGLDDVNSGQRSRGTIVRVRRQRLLADGMDALSKIYLFVNLITICEIVFVSRSCRLCH